MTDKPSKYDELLALLPDYPAAKARSIQGHDAESVKEVFRVTLTEVLNRLGWPDPREGAGFTIEKYDHDSSAPSRMGYNAECDAKVNIGHHSVWLHLEANRDNLGRLSWGIRVNDEGKHIPVDSGPQVLDEAVFNALTKLLKCPP